MTPKMIIDAHCRIRTIDQTIPDEVLDFMKSAALEKLKSEQTLFDEFLDPKKSGMTIEYSNFKAVVDKVDLLALVDRLKTQSAIRHPTRPWSEEAYWSIAFEWLGKEDSLKDRVEKLERGEQI